MDTLDYINHNDNMVKEYKNKSRNLPAYEHIYNINYNYNSNINSMIVIFKNIMYDPDYISKFERVGKLINIYFKDTIDYIFENRKTLCVNPKIISLSNFEIFKYMKTNNIKKYDIVKDKIAKLLMFYEDLEKLTELEMKDAISIQIAVMLYDYYIKL